jgi:hypothetical protein
LFFGALIAWWGTHASSRGELKREWRKYRQSLAEKTADEMFEFVRIVYQLPGAERAAETARNDMSSTSMLGAKLENRKNPVTAYEDLQEAFNIQSARLQRTAFVLAIAGLDEPAALLREIYGASVAFKNDEPGRGRYEKFNACLWKAWERFPACFRDAFSIDEPIPKRAFKKLKDFAEEQFGER